MSDSDGMSTTLQNDGAALSLLSLSMAAAAADPIPIAQPPDSGGNGVNASLGGITNGSHTSAGIAVTSIGNGVKQHRRLASTGKARRRLSDARDAATRPSPATLQTTAAALSLASLSLSSSPPPSGAINQTSASLTAASNAIPIPISASRTASHSMESKSVPLDDSAFPSPPPGTRHESSANGIQVAGISVNGSGAKNGKKRGTIFTCESCSKVYRHPSCLIKHRWEHSPHWREASKFVLSKHQQVQLLEAAAILSHLSPSSSTGTSLPEDRSLWPSFLSGGMLPPPSDADRDQAMQPSSPTSTVFQGHPTSSSVPALSMLTNRSTSVGAGPRLHDYSVPTGAVAGAGITQLRPGLLGVPTGPGAQPPGGSIPLQHEAAVPVPVPMHNGNATNGSYYREGEHGSFSGKSEPWSSPATSLHYTHSSYQSVGIPSSSDGNGGWSLPRSSLRSVSGSSRSRSKSASDGEEEDDEDDDVDMRMANDSRFGFGGRGRNGLKREEEDIGFRFSVREEDEESDTRRGRQTEEEWDGMEMDMEMD